MPTEASNDAAIDQVIAASLESISTQEIAGAYRCLCGMMLTQTAVAYRKRAIHRKDDCRSRAAARRWVDGRHGILSFTECCDCLNLDIERARAALQSFAD
jgi:hypothetical protein